MLHFYVCIPYTYCMVVPVYCIHYDGFFLYLLKIKVFCKTQEITASCTKLYSTKLAIPGKVVSLKKC